MLSSQAIMFGNGGEAEGGASGLQVVASAQRARDVLEEWLTWCEQFHVAVEAPRGDEAEGLWQLIFDHQHCLGAVHASRLGDADEALLQKLQEAGCLRTFADLAEPRGNLLWFVRGVETRVALPAGPLDDQLLTSSRAPWIFLGAPTADLPRDIVEVLTGLRAEARRITEDELAELTSEPPRPVFRREVPSVRDVLAADSLRGAQSLLELDERDQEIALWSTLVGEGVLDVEGAIRLAAQRLRQQGWLDFQQLRQAGEIYRTIQERLLSARRKGELFDRPRKGHIRAIRSDVQELTAEDWRDCVLGALANEHRIDRARAIRQAFAYAQEVYGLRMQRLRTQGRPERAIKSAINSCIRQGYLERDGALYLIRVAERGEPELRGAIAEKDAAPVATVLPIAAPGSAPPAAPAELVPSSPPVPPAPATVDSQPPPSTPPVTLASTLPATESSAPSGPSAPDAGEGSLSPLQALLQRRLYELEFPTRTLNWAERNGIATIGELVAVDPDIFAQERNVGRLTLRQTRAALEEALGVSWEQARAVLRGGSLPESLADVASPASAEGSIEEETVTAEGARGWVHCAARFGERLRDVPLDDLELPARMRNFATEEGLTTVGELLAYRYDELRARPNLGRKSLSDTLDAIQDYLTQRETTQPATFLESWRAQLTNLKPVHRLVVSRRAGVHGPRETLEEIAGMLGLTRERVRQIEVRVVERLQQKPRWRSTLLRRLGAAFGGARALPLSLLAEESWWQGIDHHRTLFGYVLQHVLGGEYQLFEAPSGTIYVARFGRDAFDAAVASATSRIERLEFPVDYDAIVHILQGECAALDASLLDELEGVLRERLHFDPRDPNQVNGFGRYRDSELLAFLNAQDEPVPVSLVEETVGRGRFPDEVMYFKRGLVGLKKHFPDFDLWQQKLVPAALEVMGRLPAGRQWLVSELHEELDAQGLLPSFLGHWHLASLLRLSGQVDYLGRLRVALRGSGQQERLHFEDLFLELLEDAGTPLPFDELLSAARTRTDVREETAKLLLNQAPFARIDKTRIGLVERDVPGGPEAVATAVEAVATHLSETSRGLTPHQATLLVQGLSEVHATWSPQLVVSLLRSEPTLRIDRSKNIGLEEWDDARCPTRAEFVRREVTRAGGSLAMDVVQARMAEMYGRAPDRSQLYALAAETGLALVGEQIVHHPESAPPPPPAAAPQLADDTPTTAPSRAPASDVVEPAAALAERAPEPPPQPRAVESAPPSVRASRTLPGIPVELRDQFDELVQEPLSERSELRRQIDAHVERFVAEYRVSEFVDLDGAYQLRQQCHLLLGRWDQLTPGERHLAHAAIRYFVIAENAESDFDIGGLDDDKRIMTAVLEHLGLGDPLPPQPEA